MNRIYCYCAKCGKSLRTNDAKYPSKNHIGLICLQCSRKENMPNIKITAEVDGKIVPLNTISTESFEAIKALEKQKEIPVARWATCSGEPRLLFKPSYDINLKVGTVYALDLKKGSKACHWTPTQDENVVTSQYKNAQSL